MLSISLSVLKVQEILKLLNVLLPALSNPEKLQILSEKEAYLRSNSDLVQMSAISLVPLLMQVGYFLSIWK